MAPETKTRMLGSPRDCQQLFCLASRLANWRSFSWISSLAGMLSWLLSALLCLTRGLHGRVYARNKLAVCYPWSIICSQIIAFAPFTGVDGVVLRRSSSSRISTFAFSSHWSRLCCRSRCLCYRCSPLFRKYDLATGPGATVAGLYLLWMVHHCTLSFVI